MPSSIRQKILVFEWLCSGGLFVDGVQPAAVPHLLTQGRLMLSSVCLDFNLSGLDVVFPIDCRIAVNGAGLPIPVDENTDLQSQLRELAEISDWILIIAPESEGRLFDCLSWLEAWNPRILNPCRAFTVLTSNKNDLQVHLATNGVPVPIGSNAFDWRKYLPDDQPCVLKPVDGCGGEKIRLLQNPLDLQFLDDSDNSHWRIEEFVPGVATSVSVICNDRESTILPPLRQEFDAHPIGLFAKCIQDLSEEVVERAIKLAEQTVEALPPTTGFFGIDMVIGERDVVIEVNPRITMSYGCLRTFVDFNLAEKMLSAKLQSQIAT